MIDAPFQRYCTEVIPEWVDYNGHMNVAYYVLAFDRGTDVLFDVLGIGADYVRTANHSMFALEGHIAYEREVRLGEPLAVRSTILAAGAVAGRRAAGTRRRRGAPCSPPTARGHRPPNRHAGMTQELHPAA